jgi:hypothetical protein
MKYSKPWTEEIRGAKRKSFITEVIKENTQNKYKQ